MELSVTRGQLSHLIGKVQGIVPLRPAVPVLANILLEAREGLLTLTATDLNLTVQVSAQVQVQREGAIALPARKLSQLVRELPEVPLRLTTGSPARLTLCAGDSQFRFNGLKADDFPPFEPFAQAPFLSIEGDRLKGLWGRSSFAASKDEGRYALNSMLMRVQEGRVTCMAADGKRLARIQEQMEVPPDLVGDYIIASRVVGEGIRLIEREPGQVQLSFLGDRLCLRMEGLVLTAKLVAGDYPEVERVIPDKPALKVEIHREEWMGLIRQTALFVHNRAQASLRCMLAPGQLTVVGESQEFGEGSASMLVPYEGEPMVVAFNPVALLEMLRHAQGEVITFAIDSPYMPGLITDETSACFVIMPMRLLQEEQVVADRVETLNAPN